MIIIKKILNQLLKQTDLNYGKDFNICTLFQNYKNEKSEITIGYYNIVDGFSKKPCFSVWDEKLHSYCSLYDSIQDENVNDGKDLFNEVKSAEDSYINDGKKILREISLKLLVNLVQIIRVMVMILACLMLSWKQIYQIWLIVLLSIR